LSPTLTREEALPVARAPRKRNAAATRATLLEVGLQEFAKFGLSGARISRILKQAKCNIRMLYHYFGSKSGLYQAVLEKAYADIRAYEARASIDTSDPVGGLLQIFELTFDYFERNPKFEGLLRFENSSKGRYLAKISGITESFIPMRRTIDALIAEGRRKGLFSASVNSVQIYTTIAALSRFHLANAFSLSNLLEADLTRKQWLLERREHGAAVLKAYLESSKRTR
jgi:AcrR family transcriptional regulator